MMSIPLSFVRLMAVAAISFCLAGCGRSDTYRYKLTFAVNTPQGVKRGSSVVEAQFFGVSFPERGIMHKLRGEALYLDLGPGARPLIALLTSQFREKDPKDIRWSHDGGPHENLLLSLYGVARSINPMDHMRTIAAIRGPRKISPADLPDLVTFADINNPMSVIAVDPNNLQATLGAGVTWSEITLESTNEPITTGLTMKLPWLPAHHAQLDGGIIRWASGPKVSLANTLSTFDFKQPVARK